MKKSMIILGAFTLLLAAPSFAQEKTKIVKEKPMKVEKVETVKVRSSQEKLTVKPAAEKIEETEETVAPKPRMKTVEPVENRKLKTTTPAKKEEKM